MAPLVFLSLFLAMWLGIRIQVLQKEVAQLTVRRELLRGQIGERRRALSGGTDLARIVPEVVERGLGPPAARQVLVLEGGALPTRANEELPRRVLDFLSEGPAVRARAADPPADRREERR